MHNTPKIKVNLLTAYPFRFAEIVVAHQIDKDLEIIENNVFQRHG
jgi:hypothetical protein